MRVALVHYWLMGSRGGEKVLEALCRLFPEADIFTLFYDPERVSPLIRSRNVQASFLNPLRRWYRSLLPVMPMALENFDLRPYDLVISSESGPAKGVITASSTRHVCYCHTPMRYLWELYPAYRKEYRGGRLTQALMVPLTNYLRLWDVATALRVDRFAANSRNVQRRIWKTYRRKSRVVYPPVPVAEFYSQRSEGYFLAVSEMVPYKRLDQSVRVFTHLGRKLKVVGDGPEFGRLRGLAGPNIEFCGRVSDADLRHLYARSSALIVPSEEDFGLTMVESLASGKPVIALARGGALEIVQRDCGVLYRDPSDAGLEGALREFDLLAADLHPELLQRQAGHFSEQVFEQNLLALLSATYRPVSRVSVATV